MTPAELRGRLLEAASPSGGWAYYRGRQSRIEASCWALLALGGAAGADFDPRPHRAFLRTLQQPGGELIDVANQANYAWNALALLTLDAAGTDEDRAVADRITAMLLDRRGIRIEGDIPEVRLDATLQAWPWMDGTFSWVEPTALALLALRRPDTRTAAAVRIDEAERLLVDRVCPGAGWNYGNGAVMGQDLRAYVPTTALALLALQASRDRPVVADGLEWLEVHATTEPSAMALSLAAICLHVYGRPVSAIAALIEEQADRTGFMDNLHLTAMALYALTLDSHGARAFRVAA